MHLSSLSGSSVLLHEYQCFAEKIAREAGLLIKEAVLNRSNNVNSTAADEASGCYVECKGGEPADLVTATDRLVEEHIKSAITKAYPEHSFVGEEENYSTECDHGHANRVERGDQNLKYDSILLGSGDPSNDNNDEVFINQKPNKFENNFSQKNLKSNPTDSVVTGLEEKTINDDSTIDLQNLNGQSQPLNLPQGWTWVVDPIDGTTNFVCGLEPFFCTSIGLCYDGIPVVGVVYAPATDQMFSARSDAGATLNGKSIHVSDQKLLRNSLVISNFGSKRDTHDSTAKIIDRVLDHPVRGIRMFGSAAMSLCYVAAGLADIYLERGIKSWDVCAGIVIVREAGGFVSSYDPKVKNTVVSGTIIASSSSTLINSIQTLVLS